MGELGDRAQRILVVEDDPAIRRFIHMVLSQRGYDVSLCGDGEEALQTLQSGSFDLVLTDLALPKLSGLQVIRAVRQQGQCPVIAMSAHWQESPLMTEAEELGCNGCLGKPFDRSQLLGVVSQHLPPAA